MRECTSTRGKPLLDERTFQQLLGAAYMLQQHNDRLLAKRPKADYAQSLSDGVIAEHVGPLIQVVPLTSEIVAHPLPPPEPARLAHLAYRYKTLSKRFPLTDEFFWKVATVVAVASVSTLLLGAAVHRFSPLPDGLALPSEMVEQKTPVQKIERVVTVLPQTGSVGTKTVAAELGAATKAAAPTVRTVVAGQRPANRVNPASEADIVAEDTLVRYGTPFATPRLRDQRKP